MIGGVDWASMFEWSAPRPGCPAEGLARFVREVCAPLSAEEIAVVAGQQLNPFPVTHALHDSWRPLDAGGWVLPSQRPLPAAYLSLLAWSDGGEFQNGDRLIQLFPTQGRSGVRAMTLAYEVPHYMPGALPYAFDGGGVFSLFDLRQPAGPDGEYPIVAVHASVLDWADAEPVAGRFGDACRKR